MIDTERLVLIVTGAHLRAEQSDRPMAYRLRDVMLQWLDERLSGPPPIDVLVCSDLWWLNNEDLRDRPTVSIGGPGVNALTAYLSDKVESAFTIDNVLTVQMDVLLTRPWAVCWGMDAGSTLRSVDAFVERYLELFLEDALKRTPRSA